METLRTPNKQSAPKTAFRPRGAREAAAGKAITAVALMAVFGRFAGPSSLPFWQPPVSSYLTPRIQFEARPLLAPAGTGVGPGMIEETVDGRKYLVRQVNPSLHRIRSWISSVGAAVAVEDLDDDGFTNDVCWVCPRINRVVITRVGLDEADRKEKLTVHLAILDRKIAEATAQNRIDDIALLTLQRDVERRRANRPCAYQPRFLEAPAFPAFNNSSVPGDPSTIAPMGTLIGDFNEDGKLDVLVYYWGRSPVLFLRNSKPWEVQCISGNENFDPVEVCLPPERWFTNAATQCDLNGDGHIDLVFGNYFQDGATVLDPRSAIPVEMGTSLSRASNGGGKHFLLWNKQPQASGQTRYFRAATVKLFKEGREIDEQHKDAYLRGWTLGMAAANFDANPTDLPGVYIANDFGHDVLLLPETTRRSNETLCFRVATGARDWMTPKSKTLGMDSFKGMGACARDFDGDGLPDISVSNIAAKWALLENHFAFASGRLPSVVKMLPPKQSKENLRQSVQSIRTAYYTEIKNGEDRMPLRDVSEELGLARSGWGWDVKAASFDNFTRLQFVRAQGFIHGHRLSRLRDGIPESELPTPLSAGRWSVLHEIATANDAALRHVTNWFTCQPGDDLSGRDRLAFYVADKDGRYIDQNGSKVPGPMVWSFSHGAAPSESFDRALLEGDPMVQPMISRGIAVADVDGDGLQDFLVANQGLHQRTTKLRPSEEHFGDSYCFINRLHTDKAGSCLELRLLLPVGDVPVGDTKPLAGPASAVPIQGRPAIGATATFIARTPEGPKIFSDSVDGGNGHSGKNSFDLHFGLGNKEDVDETIQVLIRWRNPAMPSKVQEDVFPLHPGQPGDPEARYRYTLLLKGNSASHP